MLRPAVLVSAIATAPATALAQPPCTGSASSVRLYVNVNNVRSAQGLIAATLYADDRRRFLARRGSLYVGRVPARAGTTRVCIHLPAPGIWARAVYHDADGNRRFNRNAIGLPAEGFGFSNDAPALFGLPSFRSVRLDVPRSGFETNVRMRYR